MTFLQSLLVFGGIGIAAGLLLVIAYGKLKVDEDPKIEKILEILPGINCGACGYASCHEYAAAVCKGDAAIDLCRVGGADTCKKIAQIAEVEHAGEEKILKAVVRCGVKDRKYSASYNGPETCVSTALLGGGMTCKYGCFGYNDCVEACPFDAIYLNENSLPVVNIEKCTGCGLCVQACPRDIIVLREIKDKKIVYVGCSNKQSGKDTRRVCDVGCIACKICEKKAPEGSFKVDDDLSEVIFQDKDINVEDIKCPTECIYEAE
ncbi:RnfABCDGE type electron transport complex subunit B [Elusimicrobiota bacterium]